MEATKIKCPKGAKTDEEIINVFDADNTCMHCNKCILEDGTVMCEYNRRAFR